MERTIGERDRTALADASGGTRLAAAVKRFRSRAEDANFAPMTINVLPDATRLGAVHLQVSDLARSMTWYRDVLGARVLYRAESEQQSPSVSMGAHESDMPLLVLHEHVGASPMPSRGRLGLFHVAWLLPDRAALGRFLAHVADRREPLGSADHLVSEALYLTDPDGLGVEVYADRPRSLWQHDGDEVRMASLPIDADGLLHEASGQTFTGLPADTCIGHVHLHVGDLTTSTAFYRDVLGLGVTNGSYPGAVFLAAGGYHHHLGTNTWAGARAVAASASDARLLLWELVLPDVAALDAVDARSRALGATGTRHTADRLSLHDPWGTRVDVLASAP